MNGLTEISRRGKWRFFAGLLLPLLCQSCFTGIESTPRITYKDVRRENITVNPEEEMGERFAAVPFSQWQPGRRFTVTDPKASMVYLAPVGKRAEVAPGDCLAYCGVRGVPSITGKDVAELVFVRLPQMTDTLLYRPGTDVASLAERGSLHLPFMVDLDMVSAVAGVLAGKEMYTRTDRWLNERGNEIKGRKFVRVRVDSVLPGDESYPFRVYFSSLEKKEERGAVMMSPTVGEGVPALRGFSSLFVLTDPRESYPQISDANWELIRQGRLANGMTAQEASLALGSPRDIYRRPDQSILYERWTYPGGVYLIFEDGVLTRFQQ